MGDYISVNRKAVRCGFVGIECWSPASLCIGNGCSKHSKKMLMLRFMHKCCVEPDLSKEQVDHIFVRGSEKQNTSKASRLLLTGRGLVDDQPES